MGLAQKKIKLAKAILEIEDEGILSQIQLLIDDDSEDWYKDLSKSQKSGIQQSISELNEGQVSSFSSYLDKKLNEIS